MQLLFWGSNLIHFLENSFKLVPYLLHFKIILILLGHCLNIILFKLHVVKISDINQPDIEGIYYTLGPDTPNHTDSKNVWFFVFF